MKYNGKTVPGVVVKRLPRYYRYLGELLKQDIMRISSNALSGRMNVTASQIRQDFNYFGGFGQQGYGYNVEYLYNAIGEILGLNNRYRTVIVGAGNLGRALAKHSTFAKRGFVLTGIFDIDPELIGKVINNVEIMPMSEIDRFMEENEVDIAILAVPKTAVQGAADRLIANGIKGLLNFSYAEINTENKHIVIENVHLSDALMTLSCEIKQMEENGGYDEAEETEQGVRA